MEPTMHFRWLISHRNDYERVLQQKWVNSLGLVYWEDVTEVIEPMVSVQVVDESFWRGKGET